MKNNKKSGITLVSLVIYILLFTTFTIFLSVISGNMNSKLLNSRGQAINYSNLSKLQYNIEYSTSKSNDVTVLGSKITYSNGDVYEYDEEKKIVYKNEGILCSNVNQFQVSLLQNVTPKTKKVTINVNFNKYLNELARQIVSCVEEI